MVLSESGSPEHEQQYKGNELETYQLHGWPLSKWCDWFTHEQETGQDEGWLAVPCSRYGTTSAECAWWALSAEVAYVSACGEDDEVETSLEFLMGLAVNDSPDIAVNIADCWHDIPECLRKQLGTLKDVIQLKGEL